MSEPKDFGGFVIPGIRSFLPMISDGTIGMFGALLLFLIPAKKEKGRGILTWKEAREIPWGILMLFGGGLTLAEGFTVTKLSDWVGSQVTVFANAPHFIPIFANIALIVFLTEFTSNTATVAMMLPILAGVADGIGLNPFILMIPATLAASCGFMLPAGTPPNAIIFGTGYLNVPTMARVGLAIDLLGIVAITLVSYFIVTPVFVMVR
jgi:sodium-dependent dicarboxylate transporter 2/3/5